MSGLRSNPWAVLLVLNMGFFMILLDTTIVNIAIPSIIDALNASLGDILWILNSYILVYAVLLITAGRLGDLYGQRNLFAAGLALFVAASAFAGLAQNVYELIAARVLQGVGGALLTPQTLAIITSIFPPERRGAAFGVWGAVAGVAAATGPTLGGFIVTHWSWRWIFYVNLPIGIAVLVATFLIVPDLRPGRRHSLDVGGVLLATAGLFAIVFALIEGEHYDWGPMIGPITVPMVIGVGLLILAVFALWERRQPEPLVPGALFEQRNYTIMNWVGAVVAFGMLGLFLPITIYLQSVLGMSALEAGLTMVPLSLTAMVVAPFSGRLVDKIGGKYILMFGLALFATGMGLVALRATTQSDWHDFILPLILAGVGQGCVFAPMAAVAMRDISPRIAGAASGVLNTTRQLGGVLGSTIVGAFLQIHLVSALQQQAVQKASELPPALRDRFVQGFSQAVQGGIEVGPHQSAGPQIPPGLPPQVADTMRTVAEQVFAAGFTEAMKSTLVVPIIVLGVGALSCLFIRETRKPIREPSREQMEERWDKVKEREEVPRGL